MAISTNVEAQRLIDEEIEAHMLVVRRLLKERNTYSAVDQLPDELLSAFFIAANGWGIDSARKMASVCSRWRQICLATPQLWTSISSSMCPRWCTEGLLLSRSKQCPLTVDIHDYGRGKENLSQIASNLVPHTGRFADISIGGYTEDFDTLMSLFLRPSFGIPAPLLESVSMVFSHEPCKILGQFWAQLVSLRSLTLTGVLPTTTAPMPVLTRLIIETWDHENRLSVPWMVDLLRNAPRVETFHVEVVSSTFPFSIMGTIPVSLPYLQTMDLRMMGFRELMLLSYLEIPAVTGVWLTILPRNDESIPETAKFALVQSFVARLISHDVPSLDIRIVEYRDPETTHLNLDVVDDAHPNLYLTFPTCQLNRVDLVGSLPLDKVHKLDFSFSMKDEESVAWSEKIPLFSHLRELEVEGVAVLLSIAVVRQASSQPPCETFINQELGKITISADQRSTPHDWARFIRVCQYHCRYGKRIQLRIWDCNIPISYVEYLKGCTELGWNGQGSDELVKPFEELQIDE